MHGSFRCERDAQQRAPAHFPPLILTAFPCVFFLRLFVLLDTSTLPHPNHTGLWVKIHNTYQSWISKEQQIIVLCRYAPNIVWEHTYTKQLFAVYICGVLFFVCFAKSNSSTPTQKLKPLFHRREWSTCVRRTECVCVRERQNVYVRMCVFVK